MSLFMICLVTTAASVSTPAQVAGGSVTGYTIEMRLVQHYPNQQRTVVPFPKYKLLAIHRANRPLWSAEESEAPRTQQLLDLNQHGLAAQLRAGFRKVLDVEIALDSRYFAKDAARQLLGEGVHRRAAQIGFRTTVVPGEITRYVLTQDAGGMPTSWVELYVHDTDSDQPHLPRWNSFDVLRPGEVRPFLYDPF